MVVVDDDIDPSNLNDVMWAIATRAEPVQIGRHHQERLELSLDPRVPPADEEKGITSHSKLVVDACRPFSWIDRFPKTTALDKSEAREIEQKWLSVISGQS